MSPQAQFLLSLLTLWVSKTRPHTHTLLGSKHMLICLSSRCLWNWLQWLTDVKAGDEWERDVKRESDRVGGGQERRKEKGIQRETARERKKESERKTAREKGWGRERGRQGKAGKVGARENEAAKTWENGEKDDAPERKKKKRERARDGLGCWSAEVSGDSMTLTIKTASDLPLKAAINSYTAGEVARSGLCFVTEWKRRRGGGSNTIRSIWITGCQ